ncbi:hypothetical protein V6N11_049849 [Hibiscus sabdariffa]|uniref:Uncharacterized protein n=2 Tax=Hibiscus sabdariffa TaxID=183260 RepID=A0ABR2T836_9ROSI
MERDEVMDVGVEEISGAPTDGIMDAPCDYMTYDECDLKQGSGAPSKPTFREMLMGRSFSTQPAPAIPDLDVDIQEEDVLISTIYGTPAIRFSDRLHDLVDAKLENLTVIRLLG